MVAQTLCQKIFSLFDGPTLAQLATINASGRPWARFVMAQIDDRMRFRVPTAQTTRKVTEIGCSPNVHLLVGKDLFSRRGAYAQIEGTAQIRQEPEELGRYWNPSMAQFFSGPDDPAYVLIEIRPQRIEYWDLCQEENPAVLDEESLDAFAADPPPRYWVSESGIETILA